LLAKQMCLCYNEKRDNRKAVGLITITLNNRDFAEGGYFLLEKMSIRYIINLINPITRFMDKKMTTAISYVDMASPPFCHKWGLLPTALLF